MAIRIPKYAFTALVWANEVLDYITETEPCTCEPCDECGKTPMDCSGTPCAQNCQCSECPFHSAEAAQKKVNDAIERATIRTP